MSITSELVRNVLRTSFDAFDADVVERARNRVIDVVGCTVGGAKAAGCSAVIDLVREWGGKKESSIIAHGGKVPAHSAALANSVMARSYDFEPAGPLVDGKSTPAHLSGTTVPAALAVAEQRGVSGEDFLTALILGDDLASRIIAASNLNIDSGWDCTGTVNAFGATAIAGRLYGLDEQQMLNAMGIVLNQLAGTFQNVFDGAHSFKLPQGLTAQAGIFSAALAAKGFTGIKDALLSKNGYFSLYCRSYQLEVLTKDLGERFYADNTCKPYPCCRSTHAAIDCVLDIVGSNTVNPDDVDEIVVDVTPVARSFAVGQPFKLRDVPQVDAAFNLQYTVANALLRKCVRLEHFTEEYIRDPKIMELVAKIRLTATVPAEKPLAAGVKIKMKQGGAYEKRVDIPKGNGTLTPLTRSERRQKFMDNVLFSKTVPIERAEKALALLDHVEELENVSSVIKLLVDQNHSGRGA